MVQLRLPGYEGPLQLLLDLIESQELDISEFSLVQVADQYMDQLQQLEARAADDLPEAITEFIVIGSKLILLKSRAMLPRDPEPFIDDDEEDIGRELVEMLEEYRRYRDAVSVLGTIDKSGLRSFGPTAPPEVEMPTPKGLPDDVTLELLTKLVQEAMTRAQKREQSHPEVELARDVVTVKDKIQDLRARLMSGRPVSFRSWIAEARTRVEVIVTFMAILELYKGRAVEMVQADDYGDILVETKPGANWDEVEGEGFADEQSADENDADGSATERNAPLPTVVPTPAAQPPSP
ncbi:MAG TPA: ScpA family protein [Dehalococcoidia bacterium]|nr:ScpA family protein [Dehalococcoidia bacterium]